MNIAIIGSGNVGGALAQQLIKAGHTVIMGVRLPLSEKSVRLAAKIGEGCFTSPGYAVQQCEVVIIATPPDIVLSMLPELGDLSGKVIIDSTNAISKKPESYPTVFHALKATVPGIKIVKCFNTTGFENILNPIYHGEGIDMFAAGSDVEAKKVATQLSKDIGFGECYDFGGDDKVELLEKLALSWINLAIMQGHGRNLAFKLNKRGY